MKLFDPFLPIYKKCDIGTNQEKYERICSGQLEVPRYLDIEPTNNCNFHCRFCPLGTGIIKRSKGYMSDETVDRLCEDVKKYGVGGVRLVGEGEPLLHPKVFDIVKKFKAVGVLVHIITNGSLLTEEKARKLIEAGLDGIKISFQGTDEGTYGEMRIGGDYLKTLQVVRSLYSMRGAATRPYIQVSTTITEESNEQVEQFKADIGEFCDFYNIGRTQFNHLDVDQMTVSKQEKEQIRKLKTHETMQKVFKSNCPEMFDKITVNWNGDMTLCCMDYWDDMIVGNIHEMNLQEGFLSAKADRLRRLIVDGKQGEIPPCARCYDLIPLSNRDGR